MPQNTMASKLLSLMTVMFLTVVTILPLNSAAIGDAESDELFVEIITETGQLFENYINISGQSSIPALELVWSISNLDPVNSVASESEVLLESSIFTNVTISNDIYYWELSIPVNGLNCTCLFTITI